VCDPEHPDLHRYWIQFDLVADDLPKPPVSGTVSLDGGSGRYRLLGRGVGVTGYDLDDCLGMIRDVLGEEVPSVKTMEVDPDMSRPHWDSRLVGSGSPVWRSIWFPLVRDRPQFLR
jgi:hypothetical protein